MKKEERRKTYPELTNKELLHLIRAREILMLDLEERVSKLEKKGNK